MTSLKIRSVDARAVVAPLGVPIVTASGALPKAPLLLIDLNTDEGVTGRAYLVSYNPVALKALEALVRDLGATLVGEKLVPTELEAKLRHKFVLLGGARGLGGMAVSGLDMAMWDAFAIAAKQPLCVLFGGARRPLRAYNSMGLIAPKNAAMEIENSLESGFTALKFKLGWPTLNEDLAAVHAFKAAAPSGFQLMVDYNQSLTVPEAIRRGHALDDEGLSWIEEPVRCDDYPGNAAIAAALKTRLQIGENFMGPQDMQVSLDANASDLVMPDAQQIGGVSGWMRASALAHARGIPFSSHLFVEASAHLLAVTPTFHWLEFLDIAGAVLAEPPKVVKGCVEAPDRPGIGMTWDEEAVQKYRV
jgi:mandelate racemase